MRIVSPEIARLAKLRITCPEKAEPNTRYWSMMFDVFISHSHRDKPAADAACAALEATGVRCWIAPRDVEPGAEWAASIMDAIEQCRVMVLIFSGNANASKQVQREVQSAFDQNKPVIPLRVENIEPGKSLKFYMNSVHWLDALTPPLEQHLARLTQRVTGLLGTPPSRANAQDTALQAKMEAATSSADEKIVERIIHLLGELAAMSGGRLTGLYDLFISHSAEDSAIANAYCAGLEQRGLHCWIAPRDIPLGGYYRAAITDAIDRCRGLLLIFSSSTSSAEQVIREVESAAERRIPIIPLRIENAAPTGGLRYLLATHQFLG
jgi:TIR domain-containing protein